MSSDESDVETLIRWGTPILEIVPEDDGSIIVYVGSSEGTQQGLWFESKQAFNDMMIKHDRGWEL